MIKYQLNKGNKYLETIFDSISDEIVILEKNYVINNVNKAFCVKYGVSKEEAIGSNCYKLTHGLKKICKPPECKCPVEDVLKTGKYSESIHSHYINGEKTYVEITAYPIKNDSDDITQIVKIGRDITKRKENEQKINEIKEELRLITSSAKDAIVVIDNLGKIAFWNKAAENIFGYASEEILGKDSELLFKYEYYYEVFIKTFEKSEKLGKKATIGKTLELEGTRKDGWVFPIEISISAVKIKSKWNSIAIIRDITDRKIIDYELKKSLETTKRILESLPIGVIQIGYDKKIQYVNKVAMGLLGTDREEEIIGKICHNNICPAQIDACPILDLGKKIDISEKFLLNRDGKAIEILKSVIPITIEGENLLLEAFVDIRTLKKTQKKLVESESDLKALNERLEEKVLLRTYDLGLRIKELSFLFGKTKNFKETKWKLSSEIIVGPTKKGSIEIYYLNEKQEEYQGPFLKEERDLIDSVAEVLGRFIEHRRVEKKYIDLYDNSPYGILILKMDGMAVDCNSRLEELTGYSKKEIINTNLKDSILSTPRYTTLFDKMRQTLLEGVIAGSTEFTIKKKDKKTLWVELNFSLIDVGENKLIHALFRDISILKRSEQEVVNLSHTLKSVSHELRTPLNAIIGFTDLLLKNVYGSLNEKQYEFLLHIKSSAEHQYDMIKYILDISKIDAGLLQLNIQEFKLLPYIRDINSIVKPLYEKKELKFHFEGINDSVYINADTIRFKEILLNLFSNAIKYTEKGSVTLRVMERNEYWEFQVEDTGIGIEEKDFSKVFKEFVRIERNLTNETPGTGLGLPLTKRLIETHGGKIWFRSDYGKGTTFFFTIPKNQFKTN
jgi:PAS domain S-box-containing protein